MGDYSEAFRGSRYILKLRNAVAMRNASRGGEVRFLGEIENTPAATAKAGSEAFRPGTSGLTFCYEARSDRLWVAPADQGPWLRMPGGGALTDSKAARRPR